jgi:hypothetical protein
MLLAEMEQSIPFMISIKEDPEPFRMIFGLRLPKDILTTWWWHR